MIIESRILIVSALMTRLIKDVFVDSALKKVYNVDSKINKDVHIKSKQEPRIE